ncbi:hypothetical protein ACP4OV_030555 [Aristida adscensionis]
MLVVDVAMFFAIDVLPFAVLGFCAWASIALAGDNDDDDEEEEEEEEEELMAPVVLANFPYAQGRASETVVCVICLEELRRGQLCSEVPACRHMFHEGCIRVWAWKHNSCPLCRVRIVAPARTAAVAGLAAAYDMV